MLFEVEIQQLLLHVELFMLVYILLLLVQIGILALILYTYAVRGGNSSAGATCGVFFVYLSNTSSFANWGIGAVL